MKKYEINFNQITQEDMEHYDEWGAAFMWLDDDQDLGVEYNLSYDNGKCQSAIYKTKMNYDNPEYPYLDTDYSTFEPYEVNFADKDWKEKLIKAMEDAIIKFYYTKYIYIRR